MWVFAGVYDGDGLLCPCVATPKCISIELGHDSSIRFSSIRPDADGEGLCMGKLRNGEPVNANLVANQIVIGCSLGVTWPQ